LASVPELALRTTSQAGSPTTPAVAVPVTPSKISNIGRAAPHGERIANSFQPGALPRYSHAPYGNLNDLCPCMGSRRPSQNPVMPDVVRAVRAASAVSLYRGERSGPLGPGCVRSKRSSHSLIRLRRAQTNLEGLIARPGETTSAPSWRNWGDRIVLPKSATDGE
jgi:hypothetical protein